MLVYVVFVDHGSVFNSSLLFSGNPQGGMPFFCNFIVIREEDTQEEHSSDRGAIEPRIWLLCEHTTRSRSRVEE